MMKISRHENRYPNLLLRLQDPPQSFFYEGDPELLNHAYISVVGARNIHQWVREWMEHELLPTLRVLNLGVISGGARGVDQQAHWLALRAGVPTLVVLPSGLKKKYPEIIEKLAPRERVGYISEYQLDETMRKHFFFKRNRLIAGLSERSLIVQASQRSGTMITANFALEVGSLVMSIPANPMDSMMTGNNQLLFDGATMVRDRFDLTQVLMRRF